jgi:hypothetical protein
MKLSIFILLLSSCLIHIIKSNAVELRKDDFESESTSETPILSNLRTKYGTSAARIVSEIVDTHLLKGGVECDRPVDILWVVDGSGSVSLQNYVFVCEFVRDVASYFDFFSPQFPNGAQHGYVQFSDIARLEISLKDFTNATLFGQAVVANSSSYLKGGTKTWLGIDAGQAELELNGRSASIGGAHVIIVVTDGKSGDKDLTVAAADAARAGRSTVACITIGSNFNAGETEGVVNNDNSLLYPIANWKGVEDNGAIVANITGRACGIAITVDDLENITSVIGCNVTIPVTYFPNLTQPVTLKAMISKGEIILCHSYVLQTPAEGLENSVCNDVGVGTTHIVTTSAYPPPNVTSPLSKPGAATLYVAVESKPSLENTDCGGNFTLEIYYCSTRIAINLTNIPGQPIPYRILGNPQEPLCGECPLGMSFLSTDPLSILSTICSSRCDAVGQYVDINPSTGVQTCLTCPSSCATCVAKGSIRSCTSCKTGNVLLPNIIDPAFSNPYWDSFPGLIKDSGVIDSQGEQIIPTTQALDGETAGRCISSCPSGYVGNQQSNHPGSYICNGYRRNFITEELVTLMVTFGLPIISYPKSVSCIIQFGISSLSGKIAGALSAALGIPPAAIFLRTCLDIDTNTRWIYTYGDTSGGGGGGGGGGGPTAPFMINVTNASIAVDAINKGGLCNLSSVVTFAVILGVSNINEATTALQRAFAMTTLSTDLQVLNLRSQNFQTNLPNAIWNAPSQPIPLTTNCSASDTLFSYTAPILLTTCSIYEDLNTIPSFTDLTLRNSATYCLLSPRPQPNDPSNNRGGGISLATAVIVPLVLFPLLLLCCCGAYCNWRAKRLKTISILQTAAKVRIQTNSDGLGTRERAASMSARIQQLGENPYMGNSGKRELLRQQSSKMKTGFAPVGLGIKVIENPLGKIENEVEKEVEKMKEQVQLSQQQETEKQVEESNLVIEEKQKEEKEIKENVLDVINDPIQNQASLSVSISDDSVIINPLVNVDNVDTQLSDIDSVLDSIDISKVDDTSISEWGSIQNFNEKSNSIAPARANIMSFSQQIMELVIPGSISLGMGIFSDEVAEDKKLTLIPEVNEKTIQNLPIKRDVKETHIQQQQQQIPEKKTDGGLLNVGTIKIEREVVSTQTVRLKRVEKIKGDASFNAGGRELVNFSAVSGRTLVVEEKKVGAVKVRGV